MKNKKIVFVGAPGSGKSFLSNNVFTELKSKHINSEIIHEFIRYDIQANGPMQSIWEQYRTRTKQKELEDAVPDAYDYVCIDSGTLTPYFYACLYADFNDTRQRIVLQDMYKYLLDDIALKRYDYVFFLPAKHTYEVNKNILNDGTRFQTQDETNILDDHMSLIFGKLHKFDNVYTIDCSLDKRVQTVLNIILGV
jgi:nicotinamide riboside kinase